MIVSDMSLELTGCRGPWSYKIGRATLTLSFPSDAAYNTLVIDNLLLSHISWGTASDIF